MPFRPRSEGRMRSGIPTIYSEPSPLDVVVAISDPADEIVRQAIVGTHDLLVKAAESLGLVDRLLESVPRSLMRLASRRLVSLNKTLIARFFFRLD